MRGLCMRREWVSQGGGPADVMRIDLRLVVTLMSRGPDHTILDIQLGLHCTATQSPCMFRMSGDIVPSFIPMQLRPA